MNMLSLLALATVAQLGQETRSATFDARLEFHVRCPADAKSVRAWLAVPQEDSAQTVQDLRVEAPGTHRFETDSEGNKVLYVEVTSPGKEFRLVETFRVVRREQRADLDPTKVRPLTSEERSRMARYLQSNTHVVINDEIRKIAAEIAGPETDPLKVARKTYDWVLDHVDYWVKDPNSKKASPVGSTEYCLSSRTGNCTDFHSLWTSIARAQGIPTRMVYGSFFKAELDGQDKDQSYHCWPEFYVSGLGWIPHDVAVADIFAGGFELNADNTEKVRLTTADGYTKPDPSKVEYYFGNLEERRVTWSRGRDLMLNPKPSSGPVNALAKGHFEADGTVLGEKPWGAADADTWSRKLTFKEIR